MAVYKYSNGIFGAKVKNYINEHQKYNVDATKEGISVSTKKGEVIFTHEYDKNLEIYIHTLDDMLGIQVEHKKQNKSDFTIYKNSEILKEVSLHGSFSNIIAGGEGFYFKKFDKYSGNRFYHRVVNENGVAITPPVQVIDHEINEDGTDRFYCENYRELTRDEFLEEDDQEYRNNLEDIAVYTSSGHELFYQSYVEPESPVSDIDKEFHQDMLLGAALSAVNVVAGTAVMVNAGIKKHNKEAKQNQTEEPNNQTQEEPDENGFGL